MKKTRFIQSVAAASLLALSAATFAQNIATVNGQPIPKSRLEMMEKQLNKAATAAGRQVPPEMAARLPEELVTQEVFMQEAKKQGLDQTDDYKFQADLARQSILINALFEAERTKNPVTDAEAKAEYDKFVTANSGKEYKASHILVEKEADAKKIIADLKKGGKFADIAKKQSKDPGSGANGGDLDWATAASYVPEFSEAMVKLKKGETTPEPVKSQFGWHVIRLDDTRAAQMPKFDDVKPQIIQQLTQQKLQKYQEDLRAKAKVEMTK